VFNQYYWPGREATAHLLTELTEALAADFDVTVVTGLLHDPAVEPGVVERNGVRIVRVRSTAFDRRRVSLRALNYGTYLASSALEGLGSRRPDIVLSMTDPPIIGVIAVAVARRWRVPSLTVYQDVFPEIAVALRRLDNRAVVGALGAMSRLVLRESDAIVAIGERMRQRLIDKGARPERVHVISNWVDLEQIAPGPQRNAWARANGLDSGFVVMHSGNVGYAQDLDTLVRAGTFLRDRDDIRIAIVGHGARHHEVKRLAESLEVPVEFRDYQPRDQLPQSLAAADVHVVGLARGLEGFVVPSRLYGVLAAGRPVIAAAEESSETVQTVLRAGCGVHVPPGRPELLAAAIRAAADGEYDLTAMGARAREHVELEGGRALAVSRYRELLESMLQRR
jgi:colanic acid biosynthesis glycosyl transferase WcaI